MRRLSAALFIITVVCSSASAQTPTIQDKTTGMEKHSGYFDFYWEEKTGQIWLEIDQIDHEFLYVNSLAAGLGSNDIGLDRNQLGTTRIVKFHRVGPKILMIQPNYSFRAISDNPDERKAVEDAFATSVIWGFTVGAEEEGRVLIDLTQFFLRDAHNATGRLRRSNQGNFTLDKSRSAIYLPNTKNFPKNTDFEALLTFTGDNPGEYVREVAPDPTTITLRQHHSFIELPDDGFEARVFDHRSMFGGRTGYMDFATPIDQPLRKRFISRHRLAKKDPNAEVSDPVEPIVYYVDRGAPEPIRSALIEGASWWDQAFEAAGYRNAFQVELLPEGADPLDVRYNIINWVHRSKRGWSYGGGIRDPRTGEIIKGHVVLGSQRIRQDYMIATGLVGDYKGNPNDSSVMKEMALARIRQLSAHEVGHTLGVGHNFASSVNDRASVMDYPHPRIKIAADGSLDLSEAYDVGIGAWDKVSVEFGYQDFPDGMDEEEGLRDILDRAFESGLYYLTNQDAAPAGGAHPLCNDWDNGVHPVEELENKMKIRQIALDNFSESKVRFGDSLSVLEEVLVPTYLFHRYQIEATASVVGGLYYNHQVRGGAQESAKWVPGAEQRRALSALLEAIEPQNLAIPEKLLDIIPPRAPGYAQHRELFPGNTGIVFDPLGAAETLADMTVANILHPERAARLIEFHSRNEDLPGLSEVLDELLSNTWQSPPSSGRYAEIERVVNSVVLYRLMGLAAFENASPQVRAISALKIDELKTWLASRLDSTADESQKAHFFFGVSEIEAFQKDPSRVKLAVPLSPPPGAPIGMY